MNDMPLDALRKALWNAENTGATVKRIHVTKEFIDWVMKNAGPVYEVDPEEKREDMIMGLPCQVHDGDGSPEFCLEILYQEFPQGVQELGLHNATIHNVLVAARRDGLSADAAMGQAIGLLVKQIEELFDLITGMVALSKEMMPGDIPSVRDDKVRAIITRVLEAWRPK
jgi:hypothetical protein